MPAFSQLDLAKRVPGATCNRAGAADGGKVIELLGCFGSVVKLLLLLTLSSQSGRGCTTRRRRRQQQQRGQRLPRPRAQRPQRRRTSGSLTFSSAGEVSSKTLG